MTKKIKVSCKKENLVKVRRFIGSCLNDTLLSEEESNLIVVAVDEVCANLMIHGHNCNPKSVLEVNFEKKPTLSP